MTTLDATRINYMHDFDVEPLPNATEMAAAQEDAGAYAGILAGINGGSAEEAAVEGAALVKSADPSESIDITTTRLLSGYANKSADWIEETLNAPMPTASVAEMVGKVKDTRQNVISIQSSPYKPELAMQLVLRPDDILNHDIAAMHHGQKLVGDMIRGQGFEWVPNIAGLLFISDATKDLTDLWGLAIHQSFGDDSKAIDMIWQVKMEYNKMSPADKVAFHNAVIKQASDAAESSEIKAAILMQTILDPGVNRVQMEKSIAVFNDVLTGSAIGSILTPFVKAGYMGWKVGRLLKQASQLNRSAAGQETAAALTSEGAAAARGTTQAAAASTAHPGVGFSALDSGVVEGLAGATGAVLAETRATIAGAGRFFQPLLNKQWLEPKLLTDAERAALETRKMDNIVDYYKGYYAEHGDIVAEARISERTDDFFTVDMTFDVPVLGKQKHTYTQAYTRDGQVMGRDIKDIALPKLLLASPERWINEVLRITHGNLSRVDEATVIKYAQAFVTKNLKEAARVTYKGISKRESDHVDSVLIAGDEAVNLDGTTGVVFTVEQLRAGTNVKDVHGITHRAAPLNDKQIAAYYGRRDVYDKAWMFLNHIERQKFGAEGFMEATVPFIDKLPKGEATLKKWWSEREITLMGKPYFIPNHHEIKNIIQHSPKAFRELMGRKGNKKGVKVWVSERSDGYSGGEWVRSWDDLKEWYEAGYVLMRNHPRNATLENVGKNSKYDFSLVPSQAVKQLRRNVIEHKPGYVPRIASENRYFVIQPVAKTRNGLESVTEEQAVRAFNNKEDAVAFAPSVPGAKVVRFDGVEYTGTGALIPGQRRLGVSREDLILQEAGGLFIDSRSERGVLFGMAGGKAPRLGATEALERQLQYIGQNLPMAQWRVSVVDEFLKKYGQFLNDPKDFRSGIKEVAGVPGMSTAKHTYNWIADQLRLPTSSEVAFRARLANFAEWMRSDVPLVGNTAITRKLSDWTFNIHSADPLAAMRGVNFHLMLGMFNPIQLYVQAQGASLMWSLYPQLAPLLTHQYVALRSSALSSNPAVWRNAYKVGGMKAYFKEDEWVQLVGDFRRTGLLDAVHSGNADLNAASLGFNTDFFSWKNIAGKGLMFYNEGERYVRGYAYLLARRKWIKDNPGKVVDNRASLEIMELVSKKMLNLTTANRAYWQRGVWSIPTQFQQHMAKFIEASLPGSKFTGPERLKLLIGQAALYGAAGVPLGQEILAGIAKLSGREEVDINDTALAYASEGLLSAIVEYHTGETFTTGTRGAALSGIDRILDSYFVREMPVMKWVYGASGNTYNKFEKAIGRLYPLLVNPEVEINGAQLMEAVLAAGSVFSSVNQLVQAIMWQNAQAILSSNGQVLTADQVENWDAIVGAKVLGLQSRKEADAWALQAVAKGWDDKDREALMAAKKLTLQYLNSPLIDDPTMQRNMQVQINLLLAHKPELQKRMWESIINGEDVLSRSLKRTAKHLMEGADITDLITNHAVKTTPMLREEK